MNDSVYFQRPTPAFSALTVVWREFSQNKKQWTDGCRPKYSKTYCSYVWVRQQSKWMFISEHCGHSSACVFVKGKAMMISLLDKNNCWYQIQIVFFK